MSAKDTIFHNQQRIIITKAYSVKFQLDRLKIFPKGEKRENNTQIMHNL